MTGFLERLVVQAAPTESDLRPRLPSRFEPVPGREADLERGSWLAAPDEAQEDAVLGREEVAQPRQPPAAASRRALPAVTAEGSAAALNVEVDGVPWPSPKDPAAAPRFVEPGPVGTDARLKATDTVDAAAAAPMLQTQPAPSQPHGTGSPAGTGRGTWSTDERQVKRSEDVALPARSPVKQREESRVAPQHAGSPVVEPLFQGPVMQEAHARSKPPSMAIRTSTAEYAVAEQRFEPVEASGTASRQTVPATVHPARPMSTDRPVATPLELEAAPAVAVRSENAQPPTLRPVLPEPRRREMQRPEKPPVQITIGRIEVRMVVPPAAPEKRVAPTPKALSLDDYLRQKSEGGP